MSDFARKRVQLALVIHNHQPVGNFDAVIDQACDTAYLPFMRMLLEFPRIKLGIHTSGCLWEWLEAKRPEYGELVAELVARGQVELVGGGMYEPIMPILPERDARWQIERFSAFLEQRFGKRPSGMWCPERVWEPHMPLLMASAGLRYTLLDDFHFRAAALPEQIATEYFMSEHAGALIALLPISKKLRYSIPFKLVPDTITYLRELAESSATTPLAVFGDDGEKFGVWPDTYDWVYNRGWLRDFLSALTENLDWIELLTPTELLARRRPAGKVFIPCASYAEMGEWTRVDPDAEPDAPTGFWRNYLYKYPESNSMYRRMLDVSEQLAEARAAGLDDQTLAPIADDLGRAQCNCAYWHGVFGGLYLNYLRQALSYHLLRAETALRQARPAAYAWRLQFKDYEGLGWPQVLLDDGQTAAIADPGRGLCLSRIDYRPTNFCWSDVLSRRREAYHALVPRATTEPAGEHESIHDRILAKEAGLVERLVFDKHPRVSFTTYFSDVQNPEQFTRVSVPGESAPRIAFADYGVPAAQEELGPAGVSADIPHAGFTLRKSIALADGQLTLDVKLLAGDLPPGSGEFFVEFNFTVLTDQAPDRFLQVDGEQQALRQAAQWSAVHLAELVDGWQKRALRLESPGAQRLLYYPVHTVSSSEGGFERTYQGSCLMFGYTPAALASGIRIVLAIVEL